MSLSSFGSGKVASRQLSQVSLTLPTFSRTMNLTTGMQQVLARGEPGSLLRKPWFKVTLIFSIVILCSLAVALTGCVVAHCHRKRGKPQSSSGKSDIEAGTAEAGSTHTITIRREDSSDDDLEMLAQLDALIADQTMANETFRGRELDLYRKEMKAKARRQARGAMRTSQGINLPVHVQQLKGKMRSLIRSLTRSEAVPDPMHEPSSLPGVCEQLAKISAPSATSGAHQKMVNMQGDSSEKSSASLYSPASPMLSAPLEAFLYKEPVSRRRSTTSEQSTGLEPPPYQQPALPTW